MGRSRVLSGCRAQKRSSLVCSCGLECPAAREHVDPLTSFELQPGIVRDKEAIRAHDGSDIAGSFPQQDFDFRIAARFTSRPGHARGEKMRERSFFADRMRKLGFKERQWLW